MTYESKVNGRFNTKKVSRFGSSFVLILLFWYFSSGAASAVSEYQVKALFLFKFIKYVEWPDTKTSELESPFVIGLYGDDPFAGFLHRTVENKKINDREVRIIITEDLEELGACDILFINASHSTKLGRILGALNDKPVLTVGEDKHFLEKGGIINFYIQDDKVRLQISLPSSREADLQISSRLLNVADVMKN